MDREEYDFIGTFIYIIYNNNNNKILLIYK